MTESDRNDRNEPEWIKSFLRQARKLTQDWDIATTDERWEIRKQLILLNAKQKSEVAIFWDNKLLEIGRWGKDIRMNQGHDALDREILKQQERMERGQPIELEQFFRIDKAIQDVECYRAP